MISHSKPLLFSADEFKPGVDINKICKTYGFGAIDKVLESTITESADEYSIELDVHRSCNVFNDLVKFNLILADGQLFRIYDTEYNSYDQTKNVYAKHISYDLDFDSYYELGKGKSDVKHYGVSIFSNCGEAKTICQMPNHRQEFVAKGKTVEECGVIKATPSNKNSSHITWWLYEEARPEEHFNAIKENENE